MPLALEIADNRLSLLQAIRQRGPRERIRIDPQKSLRSKPRTAALLVPAVLLLVLLATLGAYLGSQMLNRAQEDERVEAADRRQRTIRGTRVAKDDLGRAVEISGPHPESVLMAYCRPGRHGELEIAVPVPPRAGERLGIFTDRDASGSRFAILIRRRGGSGEWVAGDGSNPIAVTEAPDLPPRTPRYPVR